MIVLGIDTSDYYNTVGVVDDGKVLADFTFEARTDSLAKIVTNIDFTLKNANLTLKDIDGFGVGLGPGSWTGIRIGVTVGKMLAYSTGKPVRGIPTLEALAYGATDKSALVCPVISAGTRETVYAACYRFENGSAVRLGEYYVGDIREFLNTVTQLALFVGCGAQIIGQLRSQLADSQTAHAIEDKPRGSVVALLAAARLERGECDDVLALAPLYLKESTARAFVNRYAGSSQAKV